MKKVLHRSFKPAKCKTALQMASSRLKILKNKKDIQIKQLRRELAQLLESGQTQTARIRVEHVVREEKTVAAYELVGIYCELLVARLAVIESQKSCPIDLKEAVASVLYASQRLADVPELSDVVKHFSAKYGKDFASAAVGLRPDSGVSRLLVEKLSVKAPDGPTKVKILTEIAEEHNVTWEAKSLMEPDPKETEVLSGPSTFESARRTHVDSPQIPDNETPNFQAQPVNVQHGSSERNQVTVNSYPHDGSSSSHVHAVAPPNVNLEKTSESYHPNDRPSGDMTHEGVYMHPNPGGENSSHISRRKWEMEFADATAAARAAAESAERASIAARAAAELSSKERMMRQNSTDSQSSYSSYNNRNEHPHRRNSSSNGQSEDRPSPGRNVRTEQDNSSGANTSECVFDELSETAHGRRVRRSRDNVEIKEADIYAESGKEKQPGEADLNVGYSNEFQVSSDSSRSNSRIFSGDHVVGSDYIKSPSLKENNFAIDDKYQPRSSPEETYHYDSGHGSAAFDDYDSFFSKPEFDKEETYNDESEYGLGSSLLGSKTPARVFDNVSTSPVVPMHEPERPVKFDDYGPDSENEVEEPRNKSISGGIYVEERLNSTFQDPDEVGHDFFPSDTDEPIYDLRTREDSDSETEVGLRFGALTGGFRNKKTIPLSVMNPERNVTPSQTNVETARDSEKKPILAPPDPSSSDDDLETERQRHETETETETRASYLDSHIRDDESEEFSRRVSIRNQEKRIKQIPGARDHNRPNTKTQASTLNLPSQFSDDEHENDVQEDIPHTNAKPSIGFSRRTKGQVKAPEKFSSSAATDTVKTDKESHKESHFQQSPTKSSSLSSSSSSSSSLPKVVTMANTERHEPLAVETPSKERASHVHPKLPDYEDLLATFGSRRPNRR